MRSWTIPRPAFGLSAAAAVAGTAPVPGTGSVFSYCDFDTSWLTQLKITGSYTLPWQEIQIGGVLQNLPGQQITAQWNITQADADRPRPRPVGRRQHVARRAAHQTGDDVHAAPDASGSAGLEELQTVIGLRKRLQVMADIFNAFNSNAAVGATSNAGEPPAAINHRPTDSAWLKPLNILQARYVKFGAQFTF